MQPRERSGFRHGAIFVADWRAICRPLDRNARAKIWFLCRKLEVATKPRGCSDGVISRVGMQVLQCLLWEFLNGQTGRLDPSYAAIQKRTGLCRQSIAKGLAMLERAGVLTITRRLVRQRVSRLSPITGLPECYVGTTQGSSLYTVHEPGAWATHLAKPTGRRAPFPCRRQLDLLKTMALRWSVKLRLNHREKPAPVAMGIADLLASNAGQ